MNDDGLGMMIDRCCKKDGWIKNTSCIFIDLDVRMSDKRMKDRLINNRWMMMDG